MGTANYLNVLKTFTKAVDDLALTDSNSDAITFYPGNTDAEPPSSGQWGEINMLPHDSDPLSKTDGAHENNGICQVSLYDAETGAMPTALMTLADSLADEFKHGKSYEHFTDVKVFIQRVSLSAPRVVGRYFQADLSVYWTCYT